MASACVAPCQLSSSEQSGVRFRYSLRDVPSLQLYLPSYERVNALAYTRSNALEVSCLSALNHIL